MSRRPKQFLELRGKPVLMHSLDLFLGLEGISSLVLVINKEYRDQFAEYEKDGRLTFADPGARVGGVSRGRFLPLSRRFALRARDRGTWR